MHMEVKSHHVCTMHMAVESHHGVAMQTRTFSSARRHSNFAASTCVLVVIRYACFDICHKCQMLTLQELPDLLAQMSLLRYSRFHRSVTDHILELILDAKNIKIAQLMLEYGLSVFEL